MQLIQINEVKKFYGSQAILENVSLSIQSDEKIGIIGNNGAGKSTLVKIMAGLIEYDTGSISRSDSVKIGIQTQEEASLSETTIIDEVLLAQKEYSELKEQLDFYYKKIKENSNNPKELEKVLKEYDRVEDKYDKIGGYTYEDRIESVLDGLGIDEKGSSKRELSWFTPIKNLSGGQRKIVELAKLLVQKFDMLILDEPTNHLDLEARRWLENFILTYEGTVLLVSHDRYLLNSCIDRIIEIENHTAHFFNGNYDSYKKEKKRRVQIQWQHYKDDQKEHARLEEILKTYKYKAAYNDKFARMYHAMEKRIARFEKKMTPKPFEPNTFALDSLLTSVRASNVILRLEEITFGYDEKKILEDVNLMLLKGEHAALIGANGSGKTTLFNLILSQYKKEDLVSKKISPESGIIHLGETISIGYYSQRHEVLNEDQTLFNEVWKAGEIHKADVPKVLRSYMYTDNQFEAKVKDLSGGEKSRLQFIKIILAKPSLLMLDEPTNHLDIDSMQILENTLRKYPGAILVVSHERYFLDTIVDFVIELKDHQLTKYIGNYSEFISHKEN